MGSRQGIRRSYRWLAALTLILLCAAAPVFADSPKQISPIASIAEPPAKIYAGGETLEGIRLLSPEEMAAILRRFGQQEAERNEALERPRAIRDREASRHAYANLPPALAADLLAIHFSQTLASLNGDPSRSRSGAVLERDLRQGAGNVTIDGESELLEGGAPVRAENDEGKLKQMKEGRGIAPEASVQLASPPSVGGPLSRPVGSVPCYEAGALLGKAPGAIEFRVRCKSRQAGEEMSFFVSRAPLHGQGKPGIHGFTRRPRLAPRDGVHRFGRCLGSSGGGIACSLRSSKSTLVRGRLWVDPPSRCDHELTVTVSSSPPCGSVCTADLQVRTLFAGRPRGC